MRVHHLKPMLSWAVFLAWYLCFSASLERAELITGAVFALAMLLPMHHLHRDALATLHFKLPWLLPLVKIPWAMFQESWLLCLALFRRLVHGEAQGTFHERHRLAPADEQRTARRVLLTFGVCITPNSYLVYLDPEAGVALVRQLVGKEVSPLDREFLELP